jgi:hypothetical protein
VNDNLIGIRPNQQIENTIVKDGPGQTSPSASPNFSHNNQRLPTYVLLPGGNYGAIERDETGNIVSMSTAQAIIRMRMIAMTSSRRV